MSGTSAQSGVGGRAFLTGIVVAFVVGILASLAIRPAGGNREAAPIENGATATARPARIAWRMPVSFQSTMPVLGDNPIYVTEQIRRMSRGEIDITIYEPGEIVPAFSITDAVRDGKVHVGYTWLGYDQGKIPASPLLGAVPFGMEPWEFGAWWYEGGGRELGQALYHKHGSHILLCGMTGPETAGWFRKPVRSLADIEGLKIRFAGLGGKVIERAGASVTMLPGGEIFQALEKGAIDATEFALPIVDQALGFNRIAPYNYYPGWHQPGTFSHLAVNIDTWKTLSDADRAMLETACTAGAMRNLSNSEAKQGAIIAGFPDMGVTAETLPMDVLRELERITEDVMAEEAAKDPDFATIYASQQAFRADYALWKSRAYLPRDF
ncbi:MAG: TRAP transporter substrate-binding protein [Gammaproteobacteria bacterium]|jgi:TRAP-type mannitol/chloroaromatic compound transport system substrate-binding protein